mgnify:CR=1 FL=1
MIKKNTKVIFEEGENIKSENLVGGIPLSKGENVRIHQKGSTEVINYKVTKKEIDCIWEGEDQIINITYTLKKDKVS